MSGSSGGPSGGGIKKDGMTRGGTKNGRVYVKTERAGSDAKPKVNLPTKANPLAERGSSSPAAKSEVARSGSAGASNSSSTEVGRGPKDIGSGKSAGARGANLLDAPKVETKTAPKPSGFGGVIAKALGLGRLAGPIGAAATVMTPSETNAGEAEWLAKNKGQNASMGVTSPTPTPAKKTPAAPAPAKKAAPTPTKTAPKRVEPTPKGSPADDKIAQLVRKGFSPNDATKLASAQSAKVSSPAQYEKEQGFAKGGMPKKAKVPGMPRMPKMPATGKEAMASKFAAMTKPKKFK